MGRNESKKMTCTCGTGLNIDPGIYGVHLRVLCATTTKIANKTQKNFQKPQKTILACQLPEGMSKTKL